MPAHQFTSLGTSPAPVGGEGVADDQPMFANPVLSRRKPVRGGVSSWMMLVPLGVVLVGGSAYWAVSQMRPQPLTDSTTASAPAAPVATTPPPAAAAVVAQSAATPATPVAPAVQPPRTYAAVERPVVKHAAPVVRHRAASDAAADVSATAPQSADTSASAPATVTTPPPATTQDTSPPVINPPAPSGTP